MIYTELNMDLVETVGTPDTGVEPLSIAKTHKLWSAVQLTTTEARN
jgi:hypothetical protein